MSSDYSTIQGHEPLRVPQGWNQQERAFVVQMEEVLDDIYRRFGRLRVQDLGKDLKKVVEDVTGLSYAQYNIDVDRIETEVGQKVDQSTLANYSTTSQTATQISQYVTNNAYKLVSGITITANGVDLTGSKYIKLASGGNIKIGDLQVGGNPSSVNYQNALYYRDSNNPLKFFQIYFSNTNNIPVIQGNGYLGLIPESESEIGVLLKRNGSQSGKLKVALEPYPDPATTLVSLGTWTNHVDEVCTDYLYYWNGGYQSSRDYKHNIRPLEWSGDKLDELEPVRFQYNGDEKERIGMIYEDTVDIVPEICSEHDGAKAIDYGGLVPMLLKEIQSLRQRVAALENKR